EQRRLVGERLGGCRAQWCNVIEYVEGSAERRDDEIVRLLLNGEIAHLNRRQPTAKTRPRLPVVFREVEPELRAGEEKGRIDGIVDDRVDRSLVRQVAGDRRPAAAEVRALEDVRL